MATYAIGDIQGCFSELESLLEIINFNPHSDQLWCVGDLVNRGPQSLESIRFIKSLGDSVKCVLGNHDIHLIASYAGLQPCKPQSSLKPILDAEDAKELIDWLRHQPLLYHDPDLQWTMVHAGLLPQWDLTQAKTCAAEVEQQLQSDDYVNFLKEAYGNSPTQWTASLNDKDRWRVSLNAFTRLRMCSKDGAMDFNYKGPIGEQDPGLYAWFDIPRKSEHARIMFGHWSALGLMQTDTLLALDTGCLWGNQLTAARIDVDPVVIHSIDCTEKKKVTFS
ncbi:MAG: symmetrical bis(5'-nucleosyl)-tetraphosphatase [Pseudomonadota bacterium]